MGGFCGFDFARGRVTMTAQNPTPPTSQPPIQPNIKSPLSQQRIRDVLLSHAHISTPVMGFSAVKIPCRRVPSPPHSGEDGFVPTCRFKTHLGTDNFSVPKVGKPNAQQSCFAAESYSSISMSTNFTFGPNRSTCTNTAWLTIGPIRSSTSSPAPSILCILPS